LAPYAPFITVFGPIIGALIGAAITYFIVTKRKRLTFVQPMAQKVNACSIDTYPGMPAMRVIKTKLILYIFVYRSFISIN
jgi:hypothetical protein